MSSTNKTANYQLPQWAGTDHPTWQGDMNDAFSKIDAGMQKNKQDIKTIVDSAHAAPNYVSITCEMWDNGLLAYQAKDAKEAMERLKQGDIPESYYDADDVFRRY